MPTIHGILETALYVHDVKRSADFYRRLFDCGVLLESERLIALSVANRDVLLLFKEGATKEAFQTEGGVIPGHSSSGTHHMAFSISVEDIQAWQRKLSDNGVAIESTVKWSGRALSIYFRDPDQHLIELMTPGFWAIY